jgi:predicted dehydrogenase
MTAPIRVALVGAGDIGSLRARAVHELSELELVVVADISSARAKELAGRYGAESSERPLESLHRNDVDLVIVSTPPDSHADLSLAALAAGKHVLCEKPLSNTLESAERMCRAASENGAYLKTGFNHRYFPAFTFARRLTSSGALGSVAYVKAYAGHQGGEEFGHEWIHEGSVTGGGSLVDNGIHILDLTRLFLGDEVETAHGYSSNMIWHFEDAEDNAFALFRTSSGKTAQIHTSWTGWNGYRFWVEAVCERGYVKASYPPMSVEWGEVTEPGARARRRRKWFPLFQLKERLRGWQWTIVRSFKQELGDFAAGIRSGHEVPATGEDGLRAMQMAHAIYRSSREGKQVRV